MDSLTLIRIHTEDRLMLSEAIKNTILYRTVYEFRLRNLRDSVQMGHGRRPRPTGAEH
jgi:hypothetical protein